MPHANVASVPDAGAFRTAAREDFGHEPKIMIIGRRTVLMNESEDSAHDNKIISEHNTCPWAAIFLAMSAGVFEPGKLLYLGG
jgi:hypothetical protein